jgi:hypothetical protein
VSGVIATSALVTGCGAGVGEGTEESTASIATNSEALQVNPYFQEPEEFRDPWGYVQASGGTQADHTIGPAVCTSIQRAFLTFSRDVAGSYRSLANVTGGFSNSWGTYGNRKFGTRPACTMLSGTAVTAKFLIFGRGTLNAQNQTDQRLFWSQGNWDASGYPINPTPDTVWTAMPGSNTYNINGSPAAATGFSEEVVVTFLGDDNRIYAHRRTSQGTWGNRVQGPNLPSGWTAAGTPAITFVGNWLSEYMIIVRAWNAQGQSAFFYTFFYNGQFYGIGFPGASFTQVPLPGGAPPVNGDPALEWDYFLDTLTLYYVSNDQYVYQTSGTVYDLGQGVIRKVRSDSPTFMTAPSVVGGVMYDPGRHLVLALDFDAEIRWAQTIDDEHLLP